ncbi:23S rRNA (guanine745-N1)-methyltransferase [Paenibacillus rhizosphaerae]|uniref:23S rRNA (Guanine745-N1)-methyltransferase n=1 Tax=Paenibacillus rhizosphaerae TaxID=297318 RepID=A0A839TX89_9BACL|nr:methyltransferase domain-containing protein [Paenibacillus rhizosphaerae]MBB3130200.1 23S rRNA (guanine745-N1)-methyltransferase [Paenibacillus rhizosphaerae]
MVHNAKLTVLAGLISRHEHLFRCPICSGPLKMDGLRSMICGSRHCFDLSKDGYVNLIPHAVRSKYNKDLFTSRRETSRHGLFDPLIDAIRDKIEVMVPSRSGELRILDAGCGEGSHLTAILSALQRPDAPDILGIGVDIAKEGIRLAAKSGAPAIWCAADLAGSPFAGRQFDVILNILSPANYQEFQRLLRHDGLVIKVIPGSRYLQEIRALFHGKTANRPSTEGGRTIDWPTPANGHPIDRPSSPAGRTAELFGQKFACVDIQHVAYDMLVAGEALEHLLRMTPLSWGVPEAAIRKAAGQGPLRVTFDYDVLCGRMNE